MTEVLALGRRIDASLLRAAVGTRATMPTLLKLAGADGPAHLSEVFAVSHDLYCDIAGARMLTYL